MLTLTIASYTEKNMNFKIGVQGAMLIDTNEMIIVRWLRMSPTKRAKKGKDKRGRMSLPIKTLKTLKREKVPALVMWYLPVIDRLKRMFSNPRDTKLLLWHVNHKMDEKIRHPTDGRQ
jgi:hypothetical protein